MNKIFYKKISSILISVLIFLYPILVLTLHRGLNICFFLLFLISIYHLWRERKEIYWDNYLTGISIAMTLPTIAILLNQIYLLDFNIKAYDETLRFILGIPIFMFLRTEGKYIFSTFKIAIPLGCFFAFFVIIFLKWGVVYSDDMRLSISFLNSIHLGNIAVTLGLLSLFSINKSNKNLLVISFFLLAFLSAIYLSISTGTRGGWVSIPAIFFILFLYHVDKISWRKITIFFLGAIIICYLSYTLISIINIRVNNIMDDIILFTQSNKDTSLGVRFQIWDATIKIFMENPIFGVGETNYAFKLQELGSQNYISSDAVRLGIAEVHNQILSYSVKYGVLGLIAILLVHLMPLIMFIKKLKISSGFKEQAAFMGIAFVIMFFIFGLSVQIFNLKMTVSYYVLTIIILLSVVIPDNKFNSR
jgi:O-antigen ligase